MVVKVRFQYIAQTTMIYNYRIDLRGIPLVAWDYVVNGKAGLGDGHRQRNQQLGHRNHGQP